MLRAFEESRKPPELPPKRFRGPQKKPIKGVRIAPGKYKESPEQRKMRFLRQQNRRLKERLAQEKAKNAEKDEIVIMSSDPITPYLTKKAVNALANLGGGSEDGSACGGKVKAKRASKPKPAKLHDQELATATKKAAKKAAMSLVDLGSKVA